MSIRLLVLVFFFFQAEDGIRDLVRSRGLGDVYKRQVLCVPIDLGNGAGLQPLRPQLLKLFGINIHIRKSVSYTHLTLPTSDLV